MQFKNEVIIEGNLSRDPIIRSTAMGKSVASGSVAYNHSYQKGSEVIKEANFFDFTCWGALADSMSEFHKGQAVHIEGSLKQNTWTAQDGTKRSKIEITAWKISVIGEQKPPKKEETPHTVVNTAPDGFPDSIPF